MSSLSYKLLILYIIPLSLRIIFTVLVEFRSLDVDCLFESTALYALGVDYVLEET
jgi:hypothetical protein